MGARTTIHILLGADLDAAGVLVPDAVGHAPVSPHLLVGAVLGRVEQPAEGQVVVVVDVVALLLRGSLAATSKLPTLALPAGGASTVAAAGVVVGVVQLQVCPTLQAFLVGQGWLVTGRLAPVLLHNCHPKPPYEASGGAILNISVQDNLKKQNETKRTIKLDKCTWYKA